jgi:hypothetical protein
VSTLFALIAVMVVLPTALMVPIRRGGRIAFFLLGLIFGFGIGYVMELGGPDSPGLIIPFFGFALSLSAMLAELIAFAWQAVRRRRAVHG